MITYHACQSLTKEKTLTRRWYFYYYSCLTLYKLHLWTFVLIFSLSSSPSDAQWLVHLLLQVVAEVVEGLIAGKDAASCLLRHCCSLLKQRHSPLTLIDQQWLHKLSQLVELPPPQKSSSSCWRRRALSIESVFKWWGSSSSSNSSVGWGRKKSFTSNCRTSYLYLSRRHSLPNNIALLFTQLR